MLEKYALQAFEGVVGFKGFGVLGLKSFRPIADHVGRSGLTCLCIDIEVGFGASGF